MPLVKLCVHTHGVKRFVTCRQKRWQQASTQRHGDDPSIGNSLLTGLCDLSIQETWHVGLGRGHQRLRRDFLVGNVNSRQGLGMSVSQAASAVASSPQCQTNGNSAVSSRNDHRVIPNQIAGSTVLTSRVDDYNVTPRAPASAGKPATAGDPHSELPGDRPTTSQSLVTAMSLAPNSATTAADHRVEFACTVDEKSATTPVVAADHRPQSASTADKHNSTNTNERDIGIVHPNWPPCGATLIAVIKRIVAWRPAAQTKASFKSLR
jgi:hypothetical protein